MDNLIQDDEFYDLSEDRPFTPEMLASFMHELGGQIPELEKKIVEFEKNPQDKELVNAIFRGMHNLKGSSAAMGFKTCENIMHCMESLFDLIRSGIIQEVTENHITITLEVLAAMRELLQNIKATQKEGDEKYYELLAKITVAIKTEKGLHHDKDKDGKILEMTTRESGPQDQGGGADEFIKVSKKLVDQMLVLVGDFMQVRNSFEWLKSHYGDYNQFLDNCDNLDHYMGKLQQLALGMSLHNLKSMFATTHRLVRTTAHHLKKKVRLEVKGEDILLDKKVLDILGDPLTHMIRNSIDHGIESPSERVAANKSPEGKLTIHAFYRGSEVWIQVVDDGRGIDPIRMKEKARKMGLITQKEADSMSVSEAQCLIFRPGFSSSEVITATSGRGVGMDVVQNTIESIGGVVELNSLVGVGTTLILKLPQVLSIVECLEFLVGEQHYAIGQSSIDEVFSLKTPSVRAGLRSINDDSLIFVLGQKSFPVVDLKKIFEGGRKQEAVDGYLVVVGHGSFRMAVLVDEMVGICKIVAQALPPYVANRAYLSGVSKRGDGSILFQLDLAKVAQNVQYSGKEKQNYQKGRALEDDLRIEAHVGKSLSERHQQKLVVFQNLENFCIPIQNTGKIIHVNSKEICKVNDRFFITYEGITLPLLWIEEVLLKKERIIQNSYHIVLYNVDERIYGIPMASFEGILRMSDVYNESLQSEGINGSTILNNKTYLMLDLPGLTKLMFPLEEGKSNKVTYKKIKRLLLAEDDPFFAGQIVSLLRHKKIEVVVVEDGLAAKEFLSDPVSMESIQAVVTDIEMPRMDGLSLIKWMKTQEALNPLPVFVLTALNQSDIFQAVKELGINGFISKMGYSRILPELERIQFADGKPVPSLGPLSASIKKQALDRVFTFAINDLWFALPVGNLKEVSNISTMGSMYGPSSWSKNITFFRGKMVPVIKFSDLMENYRIFERSENKKRMSTKQIIACAGDTHFSIQIEKLGVVIPVSLMKRGEGLPQVEHQGNLLSTFVEGSYLYEGHIVCLLNVNALADYCTDRLAAEESKEVIKKESKNKSIVGLAA